MRRLLVCVVVLAACGDNLDAPEAVCGDGIVAPTEACDDGNLADGDGCSSSCMLPGCGDGVVNFDEACDDGNTVNGDGCDNNCMQTFCTNGIQTDGEECDDGNQQNGDGCDKNCTMTACGNGEVSIGEDCDDGNAIEGDGCDTNCTVSACGNEVVGPGESCDDGNTDNGDGCSASCSEETSEIEPNEDGSVSTGGFDIEGNDFASENAHANGAITSSTTIIAALTPAGDEDVFEISNTGTAPVRLRLDIWNLASGFGIGVSCGTLSIDPGLTIRTADGDELASNNDRTFDDYCPGLVYPLMPGDVVYAHVVSYFDADEIESYALDVVFEPVVCGDSDVGPGEQCDDGNSATGDGCSDTCQIEDAVSEIEPNEDGTPSLGGSGTVGNDFGSTYPDANGAITDTTTIVAAITPAGDEDVFAITNASTVATTVKLDIWNLASGYGIGVPCGSEIDTGMHIRDAAGTSLASNDDRNGGSDRCSTLSVALLPGETRYVHVVEYGDNDTIDTYALQVVYMAVMCGDGMIGPGETCDDMNTTPGDGCDDMCQIEPVCGDGVLQPSEQCDDSNTMAGDGCSDTCQLEGAVGEIEPNEDGSVSTGGSGTVGNDFGSANPDANGAYSDSVLIAASMAPVGDEDVFAFTNPGSSYVEVQFDVWNLAPGYGVGIPCATSIDTGMHVRDAAGTSLASNDDRDGASDRCSSLSVGIAPGETVYAHVVEYDDDDAIASYALEAVYSPVVCGDGVTGPGETCDDMNTTPGDGCDDMCQIEAICGDGTLQPSEQCDDGNTTPGDGCSDTCQLENAVTEVEPNEDGSVSTGGSTTVGNDFGSANADANGAFSASTVIIAALTPAGDEDVFAFTNPGTGYVNLSLDIWNPGPGYGVGVPCGTSIDTGMHIRDAAGTSLASNDDRDGFNDRCSTLTYTLAPGETVYAHVVDYGDDDVIASYVLEATYAPVVCGDGALGAGETCDDGNTTPGDGCSDTCQLEGVVPEVEPNDTTADAAVTGIDIASDTFLSGAISSVGDVDVFQVTVVKQTVMRFETFTTPGDCAAGTALATRLFDSGGTEIIADTENAGIGDCSAIVIHVAAGTYFIQVEEEGNNATVPNYVLEVAFQEDVGSETEPNEDTATASGNLAGENDSYVFGDHLVGMDSDVYAIVVPPGAAIRAEIVEGDFATATCDDLEVDSRLTLLDENGTVVVDDDDSGRGYCSKIDGTGTSPLDSAARNTSAMDKTFYLQVRASSFAQTSASGQFLYRLQLTTR